MKTSARIKQILSLALVSLLAATAMPTLASASPDDFQDNVVTVEVDLGDGPGDEQGCEGFATLDLPESTLQAAFNGRVAGNANPSAVEYLKWYWGEGNSLTNEDLDQYISDGQNGFGYLSGLGWENFAFETVPSDATVANLDYISYTISRNVLDDDGNVSSIELYYIHEDSNEDGRIDGSDSPEWITETRRTYMTDWFELTYDADDCGESNDMAFVMVGRGPVQKYNSDNGEWDIAEAGWNDEDSIVGMASANLRLKTKLIGGLISLPYRIADWPFEYDDNFMYGYDVSPVSFGDEGTAEMRAVVNIFGSNPSGTYRTNYYYQLEVNEFDYFEGIPYFGCYLGPCF
jgi:hypothetical protein